MDGADSRHVLAVLRTLTALGYLSAVRVVPPPSPAAPPHPTLAVDLKYGPGGAPAMVRLARVSKPSRRVYAGGRSLPPAASGLGEWLLSTPQGVMPGTEGRRRKVGGEVLGQVFWPGRGRPTRGRGGGEDKWKGGGG